MNASTLSAPTCTAGPLGLVLEGDPGVFAASLAVRTLADGLHEVTLALRAERPAAPPDLNLTFTLPCRDIHARWRGDHGHSRTMEPDWSRPAVSARACSQAPLLCLHSEDGRNRLTLAGSDALHPTRIGAGLREETAGFVGEVRPFPTPRAATTAATFTLRVDLRDLPFERSVADAVRWWEGLPGLAPLAVPDRGRLPMYSTWYSFHQSLDPAAVEHQCRLARDLGCGAVIVDDGWQTTDNQRGYAFCGDWKPTRLADLAGHVGRIHDLGMDFLLWYSVPFIGHRSQAHGRFVGKFLRDDTRLQTSVLDPRFAEVRDYLIGTYERAVRDWNVDGLKLDFVDAFTLPKDASPVADGGRDHADVDEAVARLLTDVAGRLRPLKPDLLIEFRQSYIGPVMRTYGNLFRAGDCPNDAIGNRQRTLDIRLLCGGTACHSDMIMWHVTDPVASAALQIQNILFSVPQISVLIDHLPADHQTMLAFWLHWWIAHRGTLLDGELRVAHPELGYTQARASSATEAIHCAYADALVQVDDRPSVAVVNARRRPGLALALTQTWGRRRCTIRDACGNILADSDRDFSAGLHDLAVPAAGLVEILAC